MASLHSKIREGLEALRAKNFERPEIEARALMSIVLGLNSAEIIAANDRDLSDDEVQNFDQLLKRRLNFEPLAYLRGAKEFLGHIFKVNSGCLIPRPETESLVEAVLDWIKSKGLKSGRILDIGTGSGCIAICLRLQLPKEFQIFAIDRSQDALNLAQENASLLGASAIEFLRWDLMRGEDLDDSRDWTIVVSNPPYIPSSQVSELQADVRDFEPRMALDGGEDGLLFLREIVDRFWPLLERPGLLALETHNQEQRDQLKMEFASLHMKDWVLGPHLMMERL